MKINRDCKEALIQRTFDPKCLSWQVKESPGMVFMQLIFFDRKVVELAEMNFLLNAYCTLEVAVFPVR